VQERVDPACNGNAKGAGPWSSSKRPCTHSPVTATCLGACPAANSQTLCLNIFSDPVSHCYVHVSKQECVAKDMCLGVLPYWHTLKISTSAAYLKAYEVVLQALHVIWKVWSRVLQNYVHLSKSRGLPNVCAWVCFFMRILWNIKYCCIIQSITVCFASC